MRVFKIVLRKTFLKNIFLKHFKRLQIFSAHERQGRDHERQGRDHDRQGRDMSAKGCDHERQRTPP